MPTPQPGILEDPRPCAALQHAGRTMPATGAYFFAPFFETPQGL